MLIIGHSISTYVFSFAQGDIRFVTLRRNPSLRLGGTWQAVHGVIEEGEKAFEAAARETLEETGLWPERFFRLEYVEQFYDHETDGIHMIPVFAAFAEGLPAVRVSQEHTAYEWCSLEETVGRFVWPSQKEAVRLIADGTAGWPEITEQLFELTGLLPRTGAAKAT
jgi:dATP pyrophosphohydrolase